MNPAQQRDTRDEFFNITLLLVSLGLWSLVVAGDLLPGSLPDIVIFDAVIITAACGICYFIKARSLNLACCLLLLCIAAIATQLFSASGDPSFLHLLPASLIVAVILLPAPWLLLVLFFELALLASHAPPAELGLLLGLAATNLTLVGLLRRYFVSQLQVSQRFQDYAAEQMNEARESRAELVLMSKQLREYQERLRVINRKLEIAFEHAEEARQLKARFAANVSHELRTPINLIVGFSEVMILAPEVYDQPLPASYEDDFQAIYRNAKHLQNMINDVLDISQLEARHLGIVKEKASLEDCAREASDMVAELIAKKGLAFRIEIPPNLPELWFDPVRIRQILLNLLVNAARFTSQGGIAIEIAAKNGEVVTSVVDTGIGLGADDIERVFEEFYQAPGGDALGERGAGLGLTLSRELIRLHGGTMAVESAGPGQGSRFSFSLPTTQRLVARMPASDGRVKTAKAEKRVLVVDRDEAVTDFFARYLKSHKLLACGDEDAALRALRQFEPDALLLAPEGDFAKLRQRVERERPSLNVIHSPMPSGRASIRRRGLRDYLVKPVSREMLRKALSPFAGNLRSIMIIDDNRDILRLYSQTLRSLQADCQVRSAEEGSRGLEMMRQRPPDLLLLDLLMPHMDGFAVMEAMRRDPALRRIPVILVSAKGASESITPNIQGQITLRRGNGFSPIELVNCVQALLDSVPQPVELGAVPAKATRANQ